MKNYSIKITGSGTLKELELALLNVADNIHIERTTLPKGVMTSPTSQWEDPTLMTVITEED